jgi:glycosyltransferase involved in cell wall biosynthesis
VKVNIIFLGDSWDDMWRRRQQLAWRLSQASFVKHVTYIEKPLTLTSLIAYWLKKTDADGRRRWRRIFSHRSNSISMTATLSVVSPVFVLPPFGILGRYLRLTQYALLKRIIKKYQKHTPIVLWVSHPMFPVELITAVPSAKVWYDCTEDFSAMTALGEQERSYYLRNDRALTEKATIVSAVSSTLFSEKQRINPRTYWIPNAVDMDMFRKELGNELIPSSLAGITEPVLTFIGGLNETRHDWELLFAVAQKRPGWRFVLIGENSLGNAMKLRIQRYPNIQCLGQKTYHELPGYLCRSQVCFQFYKSQRVNDTGNSQKLFLYVAAGKPIVSTPSADVHSYGDWVRIADNPDDFISAIEMALLEDTEQKKTKE